MQLVSWNVRTMCSDVSSKLSKKRYFRKTALIMGELKRVRIDIAALQATRLADSGQLGEHCHTFWMKRAAEVTRHRVESRYKWTEMRGSHLYHFKLKRENFI